MYYRLSCCDQTGRMIGYQWRAITREQWKAIAGGQGQLADATAHALNSSSIDPTYDDGPVYNNHVWIINQWVNDLPADQAVAIYDQIGLEEPGE